jgi:hypothetical protein
MNKDCLPDINWLYNVIRHFDSDDSLQIFQKVDFSEDLGDFNENE